MESIYPKEGRIANFRQSKKVIHPQFMILQFDGITTRKQAFSLIGKKVQWKSRSGKLLRGTITRVHGNNGGVAARFSKANLPPESLGQTIQLL